MVEKFEVGKSYTPRGVSEFSPMEIKYVGEHRSFYRVPSGQEGTVLNSDTHSYNEYVEPKVEKFERFVTRYENSAVTVTYTPSDQYGWKILGKIEITLKDGKLSSVNIVGGE